MKTTRGWTRPLAAIALLPGLLLTGLLCFAADKPAPGMKVGVVLPKAQLGQGSTGTDVAAPVRDTLISYLSGPAIEVVPLTARIPAQIAAEAQQAGCAFVLYTAVAQKQRGAGIGGFLKKAAPIASVLPAMGGMGGMGGASTAMAASVAAQTAASMAAQSAADQAIEQMTRAQAGTIKARDEVSIEFQLVAAGAPAADGKPVVGNTLKATARTDGEDLLGPLLEQVAVAVVDAATHTAAAAAPATQK